MEAPPEVKETIIASEPEAEAPIEVREGTTIIETAAPEAEIIDLTDPTSNEIRIETIGPLEYKAAAEYGNYIKVAALGLGEDVWAYQDKEGNINLRAYGTRWKKVNNVNQDEMTGFYKVEIGKNESGSISIVNEGAKPVRPEEEAIGAPERVAENMQESLDNEKYHPLGENLFVCITKTGALAYRTFAKLNGNVYRYDCDAEGNISKGSLPVLSEEESFNLMPYTENFEATSTKYSYPVKYNQTNIILTVDMDRSEK